MLNRYWAGLLTGVLVSLAIVSIPVSADIDTEEPEKMVANLPQVVEPVDLNKTFTFAGEKMPNNYDTRERLDRELLVNAYWQSSTLLNIKAANRYFPVIEKILKEEGVPDDFKYLAVAESNLRNVVSSANAKGFWQFRKLAAKEFNLEVNSEVDERYHLEKSTRAACQYLKQLYNRFGSWTNAAAAYNMGPSNFFRSSKAQNEDSYYNMNLNPETGRYLFRLIAIKEILNKPQNFGFYIDKSELYEPMDNYYIVDIDESVKSWADFAEQHNISYRILKSYNPWLIDSKLTVIKNRYQVKIPKDV